MGWHVYILKCSDNSFYTGITNNLQRRLSLHNAKKGAKSIRGKLPAKLVYFEEYADQIMAAKREREIKGWRKGKKSELVNNFNFERIEKALA